MRTRRSQSSGNPVSPFDEAHDKPHGHTPVLLHEVLDMLEILPDDTVVDATLGGAGHARAIAERLGKGGTFIGFDLDPDAVGRAKEALSEIAPRIHLVQANFRAMREELHKLGIEKVSKVLFDLGWSSYQLDSGRGFSLRNDEPLLMTYSNPPAGGGSMLTARTIVNEWAEESLADVIFGWGEERYARRIAKMIVARRQTKPFETAQELAEAIKGAVPAGYRKGRLHPATKTFQALRIAVNDELGALSQGLRGAWELLAPGGRIAVITFHSIEDRIVKHAFADLEKKGEGKRLTKKPVVPSEEETRENPRARSAKLRVIEKP
ncbi:16S rRNA (cytosine(1402)-N(4))-methyltransferase RsmH [Candidatus Kaiserbacteria bacterium]|nr:16S rRNA (cytosine(1402)-N(4))-methyltransferase RsmH [Candidatus Kaiserbacteria bacterium]